MEEFNPKEYELTPKEACKLLRVSENTLRVWRRKRFGPRPLRIGKKVWYSERIIVEYMRDCWDKVHDIDIEDENA